MEPQIRYVRSADGTNIATYTIGVSDERPPFIYTPEVGGWAIPSTEWQTPAARAGIERVAQRRRVVWFDPRGTGLSDRQVAGVSLDAWIADLDAVITQTSTSPVDLFARTLGGPYVIAYAARASNRIRRLVLWNSLAAGREFQVPEMWRLTAPIAAVNFEFFVRMRVMDSFGWTENARRRAEAAKDVVTLEALNATWAALRSSDASDQLGQILCPTLVVHQAGQEFQRVEVARRIASTIPNARLHLVRARPTAWPAPFNDDPEEDDRILLEFLDEDAPADLPTGFPEGTAIILFTDIVDSTAHTERMGDAAFRSHAREVDGHLRAIIREHRGSVVEGKVLGDGVMAVFTSTVRAIECALACHDATLGSELLLRIGIHAGDVINEGTNVYGGAVNVASRICVLCEPGEILVSRTVADLARTSAGVAFEDRGEQEMKGVAEPVRVYAVRGRE